jgi:hypothetical protein
VAGSLSNNTLYTINYELEFPGPVGDLYYITLKVTVRRLGSNYTWAIEK